MKTFYDILKVKPNATEQEIIDAYNKLEKIYKNSSENLKNIKIAKEILINSEARENYDKKLYEIKQNELISNIKNNTLKYNIKKQEENLEREKQQQVKLEKEKLQKESGLQKQVPDNKNINNDIKTDNIHELKKKTELQKEKELKKQKKLNNKLLKKEQKRQKEVYEEAYAKYLESLGFKVKRRWTLKRVKRLIISVIFIVIICTILWFIPEVRKNLIQLYEKNFIIKFFVDLIGSILEMIYNTIKRILESW